MHHQPRGTPVALQRRMLSAQHESYVTPVTIVATVHLAMLGALTFLAIRSIALNIYVQADLVTMIGLAAINGILIVEVAKQKLEQGLCITETAAQSGESPLRPILMTAMLTSRASCPLVMANGAGAHSQQCVTFVMLPAWWWPWCCRLGWCPLCTSW